MTFAGSSLEGNKALVRRLYEARDQNNLAALDNLISPQFVTYVPAYPQPQALYGPAGVKQTLTMFRAAFPDARHTINDTIAEGDKVVVLWTAQGTHRGPFMGMPPTGQLMTFVGIDVWRIVGNRIAEHDGLSQPIGGPPMR